MKLYFRPIIILIIIICSHQFILSQTQRIISVDIESNSPNHLFAKNNHPFFNLNISSKRTVRGKYFVKLKNITEKKFIAILDQKIKIEKEQNIVEIKPAIKWEAGFYEIFAHIITGDYEYFSDTLTFAYNTDSISYPQNKPDGLENFWQDTFNELDTISSDFQLEELVEKNIDDIKVYKLKYHSLDSILIKAWYCIPTIEKPIPGVLILPSYGNTSIQTPYLLAGKGFAVVAIQIHGLDVESDNYPPGDDPSARLNLDNPNKYYLRRAIAHAKRAIDFLFSRPEVDTSRIGAAGASQGGGLSLLLACLDKRINAVAATIPTLINYTTGIESGCCWRVRRTIQDYKVTKETALKTLSYFDINNQVEKLIIPILLSTHLKDRISPPNTVFALYNRIRIQNKQLLIYPKLGHEFQMTHWDLPNEWLKMILEQ